MKTLLFSIFFFLLLISCGSVNKYNDNDNIKIFNLKNLEGTYKIHPSNVENRWYHNAYTILNEFQPNDKNDTINSNSFEIKIISESVLKISYKGSNLVTDYKYKIGKNGFIKITNKLKSTGIPYFIGGIQIKKVELGQTTEKQLIINGTEIDESAIFFIPISLPKANFVYKFEKIE